MHDLILNPKLEKKKKINYACLFSDFQHILNKKVTFYVWINIPTAVI